MRRDIPWYLWTVTALASFLAIEIPALRHPDRHGTFSAYTRRLLGVTPQRRGHRLLEMGFLAALLWTASHILHEHAEASQ